MKIITALLVLYLFVFNSGSALAQQIGLPRDKQGTSRGFLIRPDSGQNLKTLVTNTITLLFAVGGIGFIMMILWGAVSWILSGGDKEKVAGARKRITTAIIGLVLLSLSFTIFVVVGQVLGLTSLQKGTFDIKGLLVP